MTESDDPGLIEPSNSSEDPAATPTVGTQENFTTAATEADPRQAADNHRAHRTPEERAASRARHARRRRRQKLVSRSLLAAGVFILAGSAWVGWRAYQAYSHLQAASAEVSTVQDQLKDITTIDRASVSATVSALQANSGAAKAAVNDPFYQAAALTPFLGANLDAVRDVTLTVDSLATDVMPALTDIAQTLQPASLAPADGAIDLAPVERISPTLQNADAAVTRARETMASIDRTALVQPVGDAVLTLWKKLDQAAAVTGPAAKVARLLPPMLGSTAPRTYLVAFQNPAEPRATGGIFGTFAVIRADRGKVTILDQGPTGRTLGIFDPPITTLSRNEQILYGKGMAGFPQDVNFTPDFPTAARLFKDMYQLRTGTTVDGVLAIDPVALSYLLKGAAPVDIGDGATISAETIVETLLSTAYQKFDEGDQSGRDAFLANATSKAFGEVMARDNDAAEVLSGIRRAVDERRLLLYSSHEAEQSDIATTSIAGVLSADPAVPTVGVFLNDGTMSKLGYYLSNEAHVATGACRPDGRRQLQVRVIMHYDAPTAGLPSYVLGTSVDRQHYTLKTNVMVFAPLGGGIVSSAERDGTSVGIARGEDLSREVGTVTVEMAPGTTTELNFNVISPTGSAATPGDLVPRLALTPGVAPWVTSVEPIPTCPAPSQ